MEISLSDVHQICARRQIVIHDLHSVTGSFGKKIFFINQALLLRLSETSMASEQEKFQRVAGLNFVPQILHHGVLERQAGPLFYTLLTLLPGDDFENTCPQTTLSQQKQLGYDVAAFLNSLHTIQGARYDIGLYIPTLPQISGTWREGHQAYWEGLQQQSAALSLNPASLRIFENAFAFLRESIPALDYQAGPKLLHNDFHPKNILLDQGRFTGVIDWECSQFGEADFDLCHLIHWCVYPSKPDVDYRPFLSALFEASPVCCQTPDLARRLTIYQIEHEIQQIIWGGQAAETWRTPRLQRWLDGEVEHLLAQLQP